MSQISYRPDIDGLRAIAVLSVLFYHAGFSQIPGGFMGVDIFFVISGYLITTIIVREIKSETFSMIGFWERRARRILPALFAVLAASLVAGWFLLLPFDLIQFGKELSSQAVFGSNILFLLQGGYFDMGDEVKPLLHTWSLAVEEQFYLFFPIGMALFARFAGTRFLWIVLPALFLSFAACILMSAISTRMAFYALPFRGWELLAGAVVALMPISSFPKWSMQIASLIGLAFIAGAVFLYTPAWAFPGWVAVFPVLGTCLVIYAGATQTYARSVLSCKPLVAIGLISYSLYLWHWPVMVYVRTVPLWDFTPLVGAACIMVSAILAALTWYAVEQPVRRKVVLSSRRSLWCFSFAGLAIAGMMGLLLVKTNGMPQRFDEQVQTYAAARHDENPYRGACDQPSLDRINSAEICQTNPDSDREPEFILWGDSYADALAPAFYDLSVEHKKNGYVVTGHGCPPVLNAVIPMPFRRFDCLKSNDAVLNLIDTKNIKEVYLVSNWDSYLMPGSLGFSDQDWYEPYKQRFENIGMAGLQRTVDRILETGAKVHIVMNVPYTNFDPPRDLSYAQLYGLALPEVPLNEYHEGLDRGIGAFQKISENSNIVYINPGAVLCNAEACFAAKDGKSLYFNPGHLSSYGAKLLKPIIAPHLD